MWAALDEGADGGKNTSLFCLPIRRICRQFGLELAVQITQAMVRDGWQKMMQRVVAQTNWGSQSSQHWPASEVDRVKDLVNSCDWCALVFVAVSSKSADLVDEQDTCAGEKPLEQPSQRNPACVPAESTEPKEDACSNFLDCETDLVLSGGKRPTIVWINDQG